MTSASKQKGNGWERALCEILAENFGGSWLRVPNSGAFTGKTNVFRKDTMSVKQIGAFRGDIIPDDSMPNIVIECKSYKDFGFHQLIQGDNKQVDGWIQQTIESADVGTTWFLCMKFNRKGEFILFEKRLLDMVKVDHYAIYKSFVFTDLRSFISNNIEIIKEICK